MSSVSVTMQTDKNDNFAHFRRTAGGNCSFMDEDHLCHLHKNYGQGLLTGTCAFYPRIFSSVGSIIEITGALSCPEMARLCLLDSDSPVLEDFDPDALPRKGFIPFARSMDNPNDLYLQQYPLIRYRMEQILLLEQYPLMFRLFVLAYLASELGEKYFHGISELDEEWLTRKLDQFTNINSLDELYKQFDDLEETEPLTMTLVYTVLKCRVDQGNSQQFESLVREIFDHYRKLLGQTFNSDLPSHELWARFNACRECFGEKAWKRGDQLLTRYVINNLYREWYTGYPDLLSYVHMMIIRVAILNFLYFSHPRLQSEADQVLENGQFDEVAVEVTYSFSKAIDHNLDFLKAMYEALEQESLFSFDYSSIITRF
jgi:lysine-N-methylase